MEGSPKHLKRTNNASQPVEVLDSDEETAGMEVIVGDKSEPSRKRVRYSSISDHNKNIESTASPSSSLLEDTQALQETGPQNTQSLPRDPADLLPMVLEILPDLCPEFALKLLTAEVEKGRFARPVEQVVEAALEIVEGYPRADDAKRNGKDLTPPVLSTYRHTEFRRDKRVGIMYTLRSLAALQQDFPRIPLP